MDDDRRDYYRIQDSVYVDFKVVSLSEATDEPAINHFEVSPRYLLLTEMYELELESRDLLRDIAERDRTLATILGNINKRITIMLAAIASEEIEEEVAPNPWVDVSEGGISFVSDRLLTKNTLLALKLLFDPSLMAISSYGVVRNSRMMDDGNYSTGIQFINLDNTSQQLLSRHVVRQMAEERRDRLRNPDDF